MKLNGMYTERKRNPGEGKKQKLLQLVLLSGSGRIRLDFVVRRASVMKLPFANNGGSFRRSVLVRGSFKPSDNLIRQD